MYKSNFEKPKYEHQLGLEPKPLLNPSSQTIAKPNVIRSVCNLKYDHHFLKSTGISECPECGESFLQTDV